MDNKCKCKTPHNKTILYKTVMTDKFDQTRNMYKCMISRVNLDLNSGI